MATLDEYKAVHGGSEPPAGKGTATEFGDGGCHTIYRGKDALEVIGRWHDESTAALALSQLRELGGKHEYTLEPSHHWVTGLGHVTRCSLCGATRTPAAPYSGIEWP